MLEVHYDFIARRRRKGQPAFNHHAKNTLYPPQRAASFDSLPLGPDPSSIPSDVHVYIPKLSKKTSLFRVNSTTVAHRGEEFKAMIEALMSDDAHSTIQELRTVPVVRDFFALWRRDKEAERRASKTAPDVNSPPLPEPSIPPSTAPVAVLPQKQAMSQYLVDFLHTPGSNVPKSPKPSRNSYAPPPRTTTRAPVRPHTANTEDQQFSSRSATSSSFSTAEVSSNSGVPIAVPPSQPGPARYSRSQSVPFEGANGGAENYSQQDVGLRGKEPLIFRSLAREDDTQRRLPIRKGSTPELGRRSVESRPSRDISPFSRNLDLKGGTSGDRLHPMPVPILSQPHPSQRGRSRKATLRETEDEAISVTPLTTFPFDHTPETPSTPGVAGLGVGRTGGLAVLDPELYRSISASKTQNSPLATQNPDASQAIPRARKTPPILDTGNRNARFFVDDPTGLVDVSSAPPPRSPVSAPSTSIRSDFHGLPSPDEGSDRFGQIVNLAHRKAIKLHPPPPSKLVFPLPPQELPNYGNDLNHAHASSVVSGNCTIPTLSSPVTTSPVSSQQISSISHRYRSRASFGSLVDHKRLSLDSLIASEFELPYLSRNISTPQFPHHNESSDAVHLAPNMLAAPVSTVTSRGRASYSSQETDSTGLDENSGAISSGSSLHGRIALPPSKAPLVVPKLTPPPRPPRSALRNSSQFTAGVLNRPNESLATTSLNVDNSEPPPLPSPISQNESIDFIDSYLTASSSHLEPPKSPHSPVHSAKAHESTISSIANFTQYYQTMPGKNEPNDLHSNTLGASGSLPTTPFTHAFDPSTSAVNLIPPNIGNIPIKAIHSRSETILLFKVSRSDTTLADLRNKIIKRFREAEGIELDAFALKYTPPRNDPSISGGRQRSLSVASTGDLSTMVDLENEAEWQKALSSSNKLVIRII